MQPQLPPIPISLSTDERDLGRVALIHTLWGVFLGCSVVYYLAGPVLRLIERSQTAGVSGVMGGVVLGAVALVVMGALIAAHLVAASSVRQKKRRAHATFMSIFMCLSVPVGTILGIYSWSVLNRPSVRALFTRG